MTLAPEVYRPRWRKHRRIWLPSGPATGTANLTAGFETGVNGNTISTGDPGNASAWDAVNIGVAATATYDNLHPADGALGAKLVQGTSGGTYLSWIAKFGTRTDHYGRVYVFLSANPATLVSWICALSGGSFNARLYLNTNGTITLTDSTGAGLATTTNAVALGKQVRVEYHFVHNVTTGSVEVKLFNDAYDYRSTEILTITNKNTGASVDRITYGFVSGGSSGDTMWLDSINGGAAAYPGTVATKSLPEAGRLHVRRFWLPN